MKARVYKSTAGVLVMMDEVGDHSLWLTWSHALNQAVQLLIYRVPRRRIFKDARHTIPINPRKR